MQRSDSLSNIENKGSTNWEPRLVFVFAALLYLPAFWWGLPHATGPMAVHGWDIDAIAGLPVLSEMHNLLISPQETWYLAYPLFHYLLLAVVYVPYFAYLYISGGIAQPSGIFPFGMADPVSTLKVLALIGRGLNVLMGAGVVLNVYLAARAIWDTRTARIAAAAIALPAPVVYYARVGNLDIPVLFWTSLAVLIIAWSVKYGFITRRAVMLGAVSALAVATKDQAYGPLVLGLLAVAVFHLLNKAEGNSRFLTKFKPAAAMGASGLIVFAFANGILIAPSRFVGHIQWVRNYDQTFFNVINLNILRPVSVEGFSLLIYDIFADIPFAAGPIFAVAALIGLLITWRSTVFTRILTIMLAGHVVLVVFPLRHTQYRYVMLPLLICSFLAARAFSAGLELDSRKARTLVAAVMLLGFAWLGLRTVDLTYQMHFDARYAAGRWFYENSVEGDRVGIFTSRNIVPHLPPGTEPVIYMLEPDAQMRIVAEPPRFILAQPDFSSIEGRNRSHFFPDEIYSRIEDGSLGYTKAASFRTEGLFSGFFLDWPLVTPGSIVNPTIDIYELEGSQ